MEIYRLPGLLLPLFDLLLAPEVDLRVALLFDVVVLDRVALLLWGCC
jgi:hypothetical protein